MRRVDCEKHAARGCKVVFRPCERSRARIMALSTTCAMLPTATRALAPSTTCTTLPSTTQAMPPSTLTTSTLTSSTTTSTFARSSPTPPLSPPSAFTEWIATQSTNRRLSLTATVGLAIGIIFTIFILLTLALWWIQRRRRRRVIEIVQSPSRGSFVWKRISGGRISSRSVTPGSAIWEKRGVGLGELR